MASRFLQVSEGRLSKASLIGGGIFASVPTRIGVSEPRLSPVLNLLPRAQSDPNFVPKTIPKKGMELG